MSTFDADLLFFVNLVGQQYSAYTTPSPSSPSPSRVSRPASTAQWIPAQSSVADKAIGGMSLAYNDSISIPCSRAVIVAHDRSMRLRACDIPCMLKWRCGVFVLTGIAPLRHCIWLHVGHLDAWVGEGACLHWFVSACTCTFGRAVFYSTASRIPPSCMDLCCALFRTHWHLFRCLPGLLEVPAGPPGAHLIIYDKLVKSH